MVRRFSMIGLMAVLVVGFGPDRGWGSEAASLPLENASPEGEDSAAAMVLVADSTLAARTTHIYRVSIDSCGHAVVTLASRPGHLDMTLLSPTGATYDTTSMEDDADVVWTETNESGHSLQSWRLKRPEVGPWTIRVKAPPRPATSGGMRYGLTVLLVGDAIHLEAGAKGRATPSGEPIVFLARVYQGKRLLDGVGILADVRFPDQSHRKVDLHDDGRFPDSVGADGTYSGALYGAMEPGRYPVLFRASRSGIPGSPNFTRLLAGGAIVQPTSAEFAGEFSDRGVDTDGDGLLDEVVVSAILNVRVRTRFHVDGVLEDSAGNQHFARAEEALEPGRRVVKLRFDRTSLSRAGIDGPYTLSRVSLAEVRDGEDLAIEDQSPAYRTKSYRNDQFAR